jgi:FMN-dependent NADH-azoreductase
MILNTFIKKNQLTLSKSQKSWLGRSIIRCYKAKHPDAEIKKVNISENGCKMSVIDYPREFLQTDAVNKIVKRFLNKNVSKKQNV